MSMVDAGQFTVVDIEVEITHVYRVSRIRPDETPVSSDELAWALQEAHATMTSGKNEGENARLNRSNATVNVVRDYTTKIPT